MLLVPGWLVTGSSGCNPVCTTPADFGDFVFLGLMVVLFSISLFVWVGSSSFRIRTAKQLRQDRDAIGEAFFVLIVLTGVSAIWIVRWLLVHGLFDADGDYIFSLIILKPREFVPLFALGVVVLAGVASFNFAISIPAARTIASHRKASAEKLSAPTTAVAGLIVGAINFLASVVALYTFIGPSKT